MTQSQAKAEERCTTIIECEDSLGISQYFSCGKPVRFKVRYISVITGRGTSDNLCGIHCNSLKKWAKRVSKLINFNAQLKITSLN